MLQEAGYSVGLACSDGVYVRGELANPGVFSGARQVLDHARVEVAVLEVSRGTLVQRGLGFDRATVGACTKVGDDHNGTAYLWGAPFVLPPPRQTTSQPLGCCHGSRNDSALCRGTYK
jgi:hypothetical protein